ncbi:low affinity iron permease family protein [bacterium]|nr:low affinity iron permease family protein [bacterium]
MEELFRRFARGVSAVSGDFRTFLLAITVILVWIVTGPVFGFSDTWQLVINTGTTIVTFLMVFVLQNTQNRDNQALQLKLDELLRSVRNARNSFLDIEELPDAELEELAEEFRVLHERAQSEKTSRSKRLKTS